MLRLQQSMSRVLGYKGDIVQPYCVLLARQILLLLHSVLPKIISAGFKALHLEYFFTTGKDEVRAWTVRVSNPIHCGGNECRELYDSGMLERDQSARGCWQNSH